MIVKIYLDFRRDRASWIGASLARLLFGASLARLLFREGPGGRSASSRVKTAPWRPSRNWSAPAPTAPARASNHADVTSALPGPPRCHIGVAHFRSERHAASPGLSR